MTADGEYVMIFIFRKSISEEMEGSEENRNIRDSPETNQRKGKTINNKMCETVIRGICFLNLK